MSLYFSQYDVTACMANGMTCCCMVMCMHKKRRIVWDKGK